MSVGADASLCKTIYTVNAGPKTLAVPLSLSGEYIDKPWRNPPYGTFSLTSASETCEIYSVRIYLYLTVDGYRKNVYWSGRYDLLASEDVKFFKAFSTAAGALDPVDVLAILDRAHLRKELINSYDKQKESLNCESLIILLFRRPV